MTIPFTCPNCGLETLVDDHLAGRSGPCYGCNKTVTVPMAETTAGRTGRPAGRKQGSGVGASIGILLVAVLAGLAAMVMVIAAIIYLVGPVIATARVETQRRLCEANLQRIGLALQQYEVDYGCFPPAYVPDENGTPMHSWRVLLLPYLDQPALYQQYNFSQPWDSAQNINLSAMMPDVYACPGDSQAAWLGETNYMVVVGPATVFPGRQCISSPQIRDGPPDTIAVVEVPAEGVSWIEPKDLDIRGMSLAIGVGGGQAIGCEHGRGANVLMADGTVKFLRDDTPGEYVESLLTASGSDVVPLDIFDD